MATAPALRELIRGCIPASLVLLAIARRIERRLVVVARLTDGRKRDYPEPDGRYIVGTIIAPFPPSIDD
jgi:hypothetical protein